MTQFTLGAGPVGIPGFQRGSNVTQSSPLGGGPVRRKRIALLYVRIRPWTRAGR